MLSFDIRATSTRAAQVEGSISPDDPVWEEGDLRPTEPLQVRARLSAAGGGRFYLSGSISAPVEMECRRCLTAVRAEVDEPVQSVFAPEGDEDASDPDVFTFDPNARELDLRPAIRELWLLAVPRYVLCQEACKGLCPKCGKDLNVGPCGCAVTQEGQGEGDSRWDALRDAAKSRS